MTASPSTFLHAADLHLGAPLDALGTRIPAEQAAHLRRLAARGFDNLVEVAVQRGVGAVVIAGDLYDTAEREIASQLRLHRGLEKLHDHGVVTFIVHGNHDPISGRYHPARPLPPSVTVFGPGAVQSHRVALAGGQEVRVAGVSFATASEQENLAARFADLPRVDVPTVGLLHTNLGDRPGHGRYAPCVEADLDAAPVDYWALGHVHLRQVTPMGGDRWWAYPGNLQGRSAKPAECGAKGVLVVAVDGGSVREPEFVACDAIRFERRPVDVSDATDIGGVIDLIHEDAEGAVLEAEGRPVLLHVELTGATPTHGVLDAERATLLETAREALGDTLGDGALVRVRVATRPAIPREQLLARQDLLAEVLTALDTVDRTPESLRTLVDESAMGKVAAGKVAAILADQPDAADDIWARVEQLLVDVLLEA